MLEAGRFALDLPSPTVHRNAARQHAEIVATAREGIASIGAGGAELRQPGGRNGASLRVGGNVHAWAGLLRDPNEDVEAARLGGGLLAQAEHVLIEGF